MQSNEIAIPVRDELEFFVGSSIQFSLPMFSEAQIHSVIERCAEHGVVLKWFGYAAPKGYTSRYDSWQYINQMPSLAQTETILSTLLDMRIPLIFERADCALIGEIVSTVVSEVAGAAEAG